VALAGRNIERRPSRHYIGRFVATFLSFGGHQIPYDTQSGLKLFKSVSDLWLTLENSFQTRWLFELELISNFRQCSGTPMSIWEMPLNHWIDIAGSKVNFRESIRILSELKRIKSLQKHENF
jgi:hypothetical protein